jgi:hypothetical protein
MPIAQPIGAHFLLPIGARIAGVNGSLDQGHIGQLLTHAHGLH